MASLKAPALDPTTVEPFVGYDYPGSLNEPCSKREWREMGNALGLTQFGVNLTGVKPACLARPRDGLYQARQRRTAEIPRL